MWECKLVPPLQRTVWKFFKKKKKRKIELPCDPAIPLLGIYLEKTIIRRDRRTPEFTAVLFTLARTWKQPRRPSAEGWVKIWNIDTMECYSAIKRTR